jgi:hypothetical protein
MEKHKAETLVRTDPGIPMGNLLRRRVTPTRQRTKCGSISAIPAATLTPLCSWYQSGCSWTVRLHSVRSFTAKNP